MKTFLTLFLLCFYAFLPTDNPEAIIQQTEVQDVKQDFIEINSLLQDSRLQGTTIGISVRNAANGEIVYSNGGDLNVHPASVMKILTSVAALETLGPEYTFGTELLTDGRKENGILKGNVYLRGKGDPTLQVKDLVTFANELKDLGIHTIQGDLYGDDTWYDDERLSQDLNWSDEPFSTGAQISALTLSPNDEYDAGTVIVKVIAGKVGEQAQVHISPHNDVLEIVNGTKTTAKGTANLVKVERQHGTNQVIVTGSMPIGANIRKLSSVWAPTDFTVHLLKAEMLKAGIQFNSTSKIGRKQTPIKASLLASKQSLPLKEILIPLMKISKNTAAEMLVKEMGQVQNGEGSWEKGLKGMEAVLKDMGMDPHKIRLRDGSGMSHKTLVTADEITNLLYQIQTKPWMEDFVHSLPLAGNQDRMTGGTLRNRMKGTPAEGKVRAKTGMLTGVRSTAGYIVTKSGKRYIVALFINNHLDESVVEILDAITVSIASQ